MSTLPEIPSRETCLCAAIRICRESPDAEPVVVVGSRHHEIIKSIVDTFGHFGRDGDWRNYSTQGFLTTKG